MPAQTNNEQKCALIWISLREWEKFLLKQINFVLKHYNVQMIVGSKENMSFQLHNQSD